MIVVTTISGTVYRFVPQDDDMTVCVYRSPRASVKGWARKDEHISTLHVWQMHLISMTIGRSMQVPLNEGGYMVSTTVKDVTLVDCPTWLVLAGL